MKRVITAFVLAAFVLGFNSDVLAQCTGTPITNFQVTGVVNVSCFGASDGEIQVTLTGGQANFTYSLVVPTGGGDIPIQSIPNVSDQVVTFSNLPPNAVFSGSYTVRVVTSNGGDIAGNTAACNERTISGISVTQPTALALGMNAITASCAGNDGTIDVTASGGTPGYTYVWTGPTNPGSTPNATGLAPGTYDVTVTDANGCQDALTGLVVEGPASITLTDGDAETCFDAAGTTANLEYTATSGDPNVYSIDFDAAANAAGFVDVPNTALPASPIVITVPGTATAATYGATLVVTNTTTTCSSAGDPITVTVLPVPTAPGVTFTPNTYCEGDAITAPTITTPNGGSTYTWYSDAGLTTPIATADGENPTNAELGFSSAAANTTTVYVTETASGCEGPSTTVTLTVNAIPAAPGVTFTPNTYCEGDAITAPTITTPNGGSTYTWYSDAGLTTPIATADGENPTNAELGFSSAAANITTVYVTETNNNNCEGPATTVTLTVNAVPVAPGVTFTPDTYCEGDAITAPTITTPNGGSTYTWYSDAGLTTPIATADGENPTNAELGFSTATANTTTVYVTETASGCEGPSTTVTLTVNAIPVAPGVTFTPNTYCEGDAITAPTITTPNGGSTYTWYSDAGLTTPIATADGENPTNAELGFSSATANVTTVYVAETNNNNCEGPATTVTLTVNAVPVAPGVTFTPNSYCEGDAITAPTITTPNGGSTYTWYSDAGLTTPIATADGENPTNAELGFSTATANTTTVYVTETASGCEGPSTTVTLTVNAIPVAPGVTFTPNTYCEGDAITAPTITTPNGGSTYTWYSDAGLTTPIATADGENPTNAELGFSSATANITTVYVTEGAGGCEGPSTTVTLTVNAVPVAPGVTFTPNTYCEGDAITAPTITTPTVGSTYTWYSDAGLTTPIATADGENPTNAELGFSSATANVTTVYVAETNNNNCEGPATTVTLTVNAVPVAPGVTFTPDTYCEGDAITAPTITTPNGGSTYTWYSDAGLTTPIATADGENPTNAELGFSTATANTTTVYVTETASGCEGPSTTVTLTVNAIPAAPGVTFTPNTYCEGDAITAPTITTPTVGSTYTWYSDAGLTTPIATADGENPTNAELGFSSATANVTTVYVAETNNNNCEGPATTVTLTVNAVPVAPGVTFTPNTYCEGDAITAPTITTPNGGSTYTWYSDAGLTTPIATADGENPTNAELGFSGATVNTTIVYVTETASGCEGPSTTVTLTVNAIPVAPGVTFTPNTYCEGDAITAPTITTPTVGSTYTWYSDAGLTTPIATADGENPTNAELGFSSATANVTTVYVAETNNNNCEGPATTVTLTVNAVPVAPGVTFTPNTYCEGDAITAPTITTPTAGSTYTWYSDAGLTTPIATADGENPTNAELGFGSATANITTVYVTETNNNNCEGPATTVTLTVNAVPVAPGVTFTPNTYCEGDAITAPTITTPNGGSTYTWYSDAGLTTPIATADGENPTNAELGFNSATANTTSVYVTETASGCEGPSTTVTLTVNAIPAAPGVTFTPNTYCEGDAITAPTITTPTAGSTYIWYSDAGLTTPIATADGENPTNAELGFGSGTANVTTVYVAETNASNCEGPATTVTLTVNAVPVAPGVTFTPNTYCEGDAITAPTITTPNAGSIYTWYSDAGLTTPIAIADDENPTNAELGFDGAAANTTTVYVTETASGCESPSTTVTLTVNAPPTAGLTSSDADNTICAGDNVTFTATPAGATNYEFFVNGVSAQSGASDNFPTTGLADDDDVHVVVTDAAGCTDASDPISTTVNTPPNAGTANTVSVCSSEAAFDLFASLGGTPDAGGTWADLDGSGAVITGNNADLTTVATGAYQFEYTVTGTAPCADATAIVTINVNEAADAGIDFNVSACNTETAFDLLGALQGTPDNGGTWADLDGSGAVITGNAVDLTTVTPDASYRFQYTVTGTAPCADAVSVLTVNVIDSAPDAGEDATVSACSTENAFNLFASLGGTPDTGGTWTDLDASGAAITGNDADLTTLAAGDYRFEYNLTVGTCGSATAIVTVSVVEPPDAGLANTVDACNSETAFDLFASLGGTPDTGGTWTEISASGAPISGNAVDLSGVAAGSYQFGYTVSATTPCADPVAIVTVNVVEAVSAGADNTVAVCNSETAFDMFAVLGGTPTAGGTWTDLDGSGATITGNAIDLATFPVPPGSYTFEYTVTGTTPCANDAAVLTLNVLNSAPDAGEDNSAAACADATAFDLFASLGGTPDNGGTWNDLDASGAPIAGNTVDLTGLTAGDYNFEYVLSVAGCGNDAATVTVTVSEPSDAGQDSTVSICGSETAFDLYASLAGTPEASGTWTELTASGAPVTGNTVDFTGVASGAYQFQYTVAGVGACASPTAIVTVDLSAPPSAADAGADQVLCGTFFTNLDAADPAEGDGSWLVVGAGGLVIDPTNRNSQFVGVAGNAYTLRWVVTNGSCSPTTDEVVINFIASPTVTDYTVCVNGTPGDLTASAVGADSFNWYHYTDPTNPATRTLITNTLTGVYTPAGELDLTVAGEKVYEVTAMYGTCESPIAEIEVEVSNTGACGGGGGPGGGTGSGECATVVIVPQPTPATCTNSDGSITFGIRPFVPVDNPDGVKITIQGVSTTNLSVSRTNFNDSIFQDLPVGTYDYTIEYGQASCTKTGQVTIDQSGTVGAPSVSDIVQPTCFGSTTGAVTLNVAGEDGNVLEWSLDGGITDPFKSFVAGTQITGIPAGPAPTFEQVISVRRDASDPCFASVRFVIEEAMADIETTFDITSATCDGNDGAITTIASTGGGGGYQYSLNGGQDFQTETEFTGLAGGMYTLTVQDASGCQKDFPASVTFPGFINATINKSNADCSNNGASGVLTVSITDPGTYQVALSADQFNAPPDEEYLNYSSPFVSFSGLASGDYYIYMKSNTAACPTRSAPVNITGPSPVSFNLEPACTGTELSLNLTNMVADATTPVEIRVLRKLTSEAVQTITIPVVPATGNFRLDHDDYAFLSLPGEYVIQMVQVNQIAFCEIVSPLVDLTVPEPLTLVVGTATESLPDRATGTLLITGISGGLDPYMARIELDSASSPALPVYETDFVDVPPNDNQVFENTFGAIPAGRYVVQVTDALGCAIEGVARVPMNIDIFIPNIFTPNEDGSNDIFFIRNLPSAEAGLVRLTITSRWGKTVYTTDSYQNDWDAEGEADGIYFYQLQINESEPITGWVEVLRGKQP